MAMRQGAWTKGEEIAAKWRGGWKTIWEPKMNILSNLLEKNNIAEKL